ncbi:MAG: hypothetical protein V7607_2638 [Solirubrobacteraceae bacterium]
MLPSGRLDGPVVIMGACGNAGRMHAQIYRSLGVRTVAVDPAATNAPAAVPWADGVVDVCTPTALHASSLVEAYRLGARRFIVEKPAARSLQDWRVAVAAAPKALIWSVHHQLWSQAFRVARDAVPEPVAVMCAFDKDRATDDQRGRGSSLDGGVPHVLQVEIPHQIAMAMAIDPIMRVASAAVAARGQRGAVTDAPIAVRLNMSSSRTQAVLESHLGAPRRRSLCLTDDHGGEVTVEFPVTGELTAVVRLAVAGRAPRTLFVGEDNALRRTLATALDCLGRAQIPSDASADFAGLVLSHIDDAKRMLRATDPSAQQHDAAVPAAA